MNLPGFLTNNTFWIAFLTVATLVASEFLGINPEDIDIEFGAALVVALLTAFVGNGITGVIGELLRWLNRPQV